MTGRAGDSPAEDFADVADAAPALDLLLSDAALGIMRRFRPDGSTLRFGLRLARRPWTVTRRSAALAGELGKIAVGRSAVAPAPRDRRFADPAWMGNPFLRRILQAYLAGGALAESLLDDADLGWRDGERVGFVVHNVVDAAAPSNNPVLSPGTWKALVDTGGLSAVRGAARVRVGHGGHPEGPGDGGAGRLRGRPRPRRLARGRGAAGGDLRADPVRAGHAARARVPAGDRAADDQQVLRHRPGARPQHRRVPGVAGPPGVRDLLAQPGRPAPGLGHRRLRPGHRGRAERGAVDLRGGEGQHLRALLGRHRVLDGGRAPGRHRRPGAARVAVSRGDRARPGAGGHRGGAGRRARGGAGRRGLTAPAATWTAGRWPRCSPGCGPTT